MKSGPVAQRLLIGAITPRQIWIAAAAIVASLLALPALDLPAFANPGFSISQPTVNVTVGETMTAVTETYTASFDVASIDVTPLSHHGLSFDVGTLTLSGASNKPGHFTFLIAASDTGTITETATLTVISQCPAKINIGADIASVCLSDGVVYPLPEQGAAPDSVTAQLNSTDPDPHAVYGAQTDGCAACHRTHADTSTAFSVTSQVSRSAQCLGCHDGTGAATNVLLEYSDTATGGMLNNPADRAYYTHDALAVNTGHVASSSDEDGSSVVVNEFFGVSNRHSDCVDCHNPHSVTATPQSTQQFELGSSRGWAVSGALRGVSVVLGQPDTTSAFVARASTGDTWTVGAVSVLIPPNSEYELCLKCHSSFTLLAANDPAAPSRDWLNKRDEIDSDINVNMSFHPITRKGTNHSETMTANLAGPSTYKVWKFSDTDTVRCTNCHAAGAVAGGAGQLLAPHASANRGILLAPYRDRALLQATDAVDLGRFALCFTCHTDVPFKNQTTSGTGFRYHFEHTAQVGGTGNDSGSIDSLGAGRGHTLCSECHFRLHSTRNAISGQTINGSRLVNFAPNVETVTVAGVPTLQWTPRGSDGTPGTCTLKCHGKVHFGTAY